MTHTLLRLPARRAAATVRLLILAACVLLLGGSGAGLVHAAAADDSITLISPNNTTIAESDDYATQVVGRPWNGNSTDQFALLSYLTPPTSSGGIWSSQISNHGAAIFVVDPNLAGPFTYLGAPTGLNYPIDTARFSHLRVRMYSSVAGRIVVWWIPANTYAPSGNSNFFDTQVGWQTYDLDLTQTGFGSGGAAWTSQPTWKGLRFDPVSGPNNYAGNTIQIDWMRLTPPTGSTVTVTWRAGGGSPVNLYLTTSLNGADEEYIATNISATASSYTWNSAGMAPGTYYIHAVKGGASSYSGPLVVNQAPVFTIEAPSPSSGDDFATTVLGKPWDASSLSQFQRTDNISNLSLGPGYIRGTGSIQAGGHADPQLWFLNQDRAHIINADRYHYVSYHFYLAAPTNPTNGQYPQDNIGPRILWTRSDQQQVVVAQQTYAYIAFYNRWLNVAFDMRTTPEAPGNYNTGWNGTVPTFRLDPNEEDGAFGSGVTPPYFKLGEFRLTADPTVANGGATTISWAPIKSSGRITLYYNTSQTIGGTTITSLPLSAGGYVWRPTGLPNGTYWVSAISTDGLNGFRQLALAPLVVGGSHPCPPTFSDVPASQPFYSFIRDLDCANIVAGYNDNTFRPSANATRGTLAQWVVLARGWALDTTGGPHFADVPPTDPLYPYIETAYNHGVISGYGDGTFRSSAAVTRGQASKIVVNAMGWTIDTSDGPHFSDVPSANVFYGQIETMYHHGVISGYGNGTFLWGNSLTRGQLTKVLDLAIQ